MSTKFKFIQPRVKGKLAKISLNEKIRQMHKSGMSHKDIAAALETKYQRVRNVVGARVRETAIIAVEDSVVNRELVAS